MLPFNGTAFIEFGIDNLSIRYRQGDVHFIIFLKMIGRVRFIVYDKNAGLSCQNLQQEVYIMEKARVYYTDFRAKLGEGLPTKLKRLMKKAGISEIDMENKFSVTIFEIGYKCSSCRSFIAYHNSTAVYSDFFQPIKNIFSKVIISYHRND